MDGITESLAFDRASVRTIDANGRLQISRTNISKANVNAYYGREIPGSEELGLEPNKLYRLWRHPDELRKAAKTFNNIPVLSKHIPDFPTDPPNEFRVGVTHSNAEFDGTYLTVGMSIWDNSAIAGIESGEQRELSASYKYVADMTPGVTPDGEPYDGVMRDIFGNHEALVPDGRAGPDVLVADSLPPELNHMRKHKVAAIRATLKPLLAQDADLEAEVRKALLALDEAEKEDEKENKTADDEDDDEKDKKKTADDEDDEEDDKVSRTAMDSAIRLAADSATKKAAENFRKIREAEQVVRPLIGDVVAMDSAEDVYRTALEQSGVDIAGVHPSAYPAMVKMAISQKENSRPVIAQDSASVSEFEKAFPTAGKLKRG
ncbi:DNA primase [Klebsiella quasipneumoniae subsp. similipneumoniae]|nr:DNA primase [Klebsiella quasipneumoniae subsp. similipneumoniae]